MKEGYTALVPVFACSRMYINRIGHFSHIMEYDYKDNGQKTAFGSDYYAYLQNKHNYMEEISSLQEKLQYYLDNEHNFINKHPVHQKISLCSIQFRARNLPFVQWAIEFEGKFQKGINLYENEIETETLEYPIYALYILEIPLKLIDIKTHLSLTIDPSHRFLEFRGNIGDVLGPKESIELQL